MTTKRCPIFPLIVLMFSLLVSPWGSKEIIAWANPPVYDLVILNGTVVSPSTDHVLEGYHLGILDEKIVRITKEPIHGVHVIDASGLVVSPGFIDLISYEPNNVGIPLKIHDGVTSNLLMHGGTNNAAQWYQSWINRGLPINFGASTFMTQMRWPFVGGSIDRTITNENHINQLAQNVRSNIENGALGVSYSFEYVPGISESEIIPVLQVAAEYGAPSFYHTRYSAIDPPNHGPVGVEEVIDYARRTGVAVHVMHVNSTGGTGHMEDVLAMIQQANDEGLDITACVYPYNAWATYLASARFRPGWQERFNITYNDLQITGSAQRLTAATFQQYRSRQGLLVYAHNSMPEEELHLALQDPNIMLGSDTIITPGHNNHPRGAGTFTRLFGTYVRDEQVISLLEAVKKASYLPAQRLEGIAPSMHFKGRIEVGADADLTIFNPNTIQAMSTPERPGTPAQGVEYVIVNGTIVKTPEGLVQGVTPGKPIRSYFVDKTQVPTPLAMEMHYEGTVTDYDLFYYINGIPFISVETFQRIGLEVERKQDGTLQVLETQLQVGSPYARVFELAATDTLRRLHQEPVPFKGDVYLHPLDAVKILEGRYSLSFINNIVDVEKIAMGEN